MKRSSSILAIILTISVGFVLAGDFWKEKKYSSRSDREIMQKSKFKDMAYQGSLGLQRNTGICDCEDICSRNLFRRMPWGGRYRE